MPERQRNSRDWQETIATASDLEVLIGYNMKRTYGIVRNDFQSALGEDELAPRVISAL